jgi:hypothetical protein
LVKRLNNTKPSAPAATSFCEDVGNRSKEGAQFDSHRDMQTGFDIAHQFGVGSSSSKPVKAGSLGKK